MTSTTKTTTTTATSPVGTAVRSVQRGHQVAVQFSAHGVQRVDAHAHASGDRGDQRYIAVTVGDCLTYLYDRDALAAHVRAWREAAAHNQSLRLPTAPAAQVAGPDGGQDVTVVCTVFGAQQHAVTVEAGQSARVLSVVVGAVTVWVHSSAALRLPAGLEPRSGPRGDPGGARGVDGRDLSRRRWPGPWGPGHLRAVVHSTPPIRPGPRRGPCADEHLPGHQPHQPRRARAGLSGATTTCPTGRRWPGPTPTPRRCAPSSSSTRLTAGPWPRTARAPPGCPKA